MTRQGEQQPLSPRRPEELRALLKQRLRVEKEQKNVAKVMQQERNKLRARWRKRNLSAKHSPDGTSRLRTASEATRGEYRSRGEGLLERYKHEAEKKPSDDIDPVKFVNWLFGLKPFLVEATWRSYRIHATSVLKDRGWPGTVRAVEMLEAVPQIGRDTGHAGRFEHAHFERLKETLRGMQDPAAAWLLDWLVAGIHIGLSPMEWRLATVAKRDNEIWLDVNTENKGKPIVGRSLGISDFRSETLDAIMRMVGRSKEKVAPGTWLTRQSKVSALLRDTCKTLFPRMRLRYTLHSPRSQFIANVASVCDAAVAAALAGEICGHEQRLYYTHAKPAWSRESMPDLPKPDPQLLAHMKERVEWYNLRIEARYGPRRTRAKAALPD